MVNWPKETCAGQENIPSKKTRPKHQLKREIEMLVNCQMWITYPPTHTLLKASLSCTFLKIMKRWSRWLSKDEVQPWDTCPEPIELRLIGCSTESIWNPRSKSKMMTAKPNSQTYWQREFFVWRVETSSPFVQHNKFLVKKRLPVKTEGEAKTQWFQRRRDQSTWFLRRPRSAIENLPQDLWYPVYLENVDEGQGEHTGKGRASIKETLCGDGSWNSCFKSFRVCVKSEEKHWAELAVRGEKLTQQRFYEAEEDVSNIWQREIQILLSMRINQECESPTITALTGGSMGWSGSKRREKFVWRIGNED